MPNPLQERLAQVLLEKIRSDEHPSVTHMEMLESIAPPNVLAEYALHLMERIENDTYPSIPMMRRAQEVASRFGG